MTEKKFAWQFHEVWRWPLPIPNANSLSRRRNNAKMRRWAATLIVVMAACAKQIQVGNTRSDLIGNVYTRLEAFLLIFATHVIIYSMRCELCVASSICHIHLRQRRRWKIRISVMFCKICANCVCGGIGANTRELHIIDYSLIYLFIIYCGQCKRRWIDRNGRNVKWKKKNKIETNRMENWRSVMWNVCAIMMCFFSTSFVFPIATKQRATLNEWIVFDSMANINWMNLIGTRFVSE